VAWPERTWAIEGAEGLSHLLAQQLLAAGEQVLDVPPKLAARVRLLASGDTNKNDPNDARAVAVAALRSPGRRPVTADDHAAVLQVWSKRHRDLGRTRTQVACRLHVVLCELLPGGFSKRITAGQAAQVLASITPQNAVQAARCELAAAFTEDLARAWPPPYDRARCPAPCRAFPGRCHSAAGEAAGPGGTPAAKRGRTTWRCGEATAIPGHKEGHQPPMTPPPLPHTPRKDRLSLLTQRGIRST
jgi:hypothetical protein